jgi:hypothetical protein
MLLVVRIHKKMGVSRCMARLKLPYRPDVVEFVHPLALRVDNGRVAVVKPVSYMYTWVTNEGVMFYNAEDVDIAFLFVRWSDGRKRFYDVYVSDRVDSETYSAVIKLVDELWTHWGSFSLIEETLNGKTAKELRKILLSLIPPDA